MTAPTYGITYNDPLDEIGGFDATQISATSTPFTTTDVEKWIDRGAGILEGLRASLGLTISTESAKAPFREGIISFAKAKCYERLNRLDDARAAMSDFRESKRSIREMPDEVDNAGGADSQIKSNIDTNEPTKRKFGTYTKRNGGFKGW